MDDSKDKIIKKVHEELDKDLEDLEQYGVESLSAVIRFNGDRETQKTPPKAATK